MSNTTNKHIGNILYSLSDKDLKEVFEQYSKKCNFNNCIKWEDKVIEKFTEIINCNNFDYDGNVNNELSIDMFIDEIETVYEQAILEGVNHATIVIKTDADIVYNINDLNDKFQCDEFDYNFDDLFSISSALFPLLTGNIIDIKIK